MKTLIVILALTTLCLAQETCDMRFFKNGINNNDYIYLENDNVAPFTGWAWVDPHTQTDKEERTYSSLRAVQGGFCESCTLTIYSKATFSGLSEYYSFRDDFQFEFPFCAKSFILDCPIEFPEEEEEEEVTEEEEEEQEESLIEFEELTPAEANTPEINNIRTTGINESVRRLINNNKIPEGNYVITAINYSGIATNFDNVYKFNVNVSNGSDNYNIVILMVYTPGFFDLIENHYYPI